MATPRSSPSRANVSVLLRFSSKTFTASFLRLLEEDVVKRCRNRESNNRPPGADNLLVREPNTNIPQQMPHAIEAVEKHGESKEALERNLRRRGPRRDRRNHARSLKVPSSVRSSEVCEAEQVERAAEGDAGDAVQRRS